MILSTTVYRGLVPGMKDTFMAKHKQDHMTTFLYSVLSYCPFYNIHFESNHRCTDGKCISNLKLCHWSKKSLSYT